MGVESAGRGPAPLVAIVGMGPRGLYCLEALVRAFRARPLRTGLRIAIFNKSSYFGVSPIYDPDQPAYLLSNVRAKELDLWDSGGSATGTPSGPGFVRWYNSSCRPSTPLDPDTYPSRASVGRYLFHGFQRMMSTLPEGIRISKFTAEVTDIVPGRTGYRVKFVDLSGGRDEVIAQKVLLSTGHSFIRPTTRERHYRCFADKQPWTSYIPHAYPVAENLGCVPTGARVAMKGMGLTFIDAVLALTEGRGGTFRRTADGRLCYLLSGREPKLIVPFSHSGLPMAPKPRDFPSAMRPLTFVTAARLADLRRRSHTGKLDLNRDIWPLVELEMQLRYYRTAVRDPSDQRALERCGGDPGALREVIGEFLTARPGVAPFDCGQVLDPTRGLRFTTGEEFHAYVARYLRQEIDHARGGLAASPARAAVSMWYEIRAALKPFVAHGGLTPDSHRVLLEHYFPLFKRVVFGPPIISIEKVLALHLAGVLDFSVARNPRVVARRSTGYFELRTRPDVGRATQSAEVLVDARYPTVEILDDISPLYQSLRRRKLIRAFTNVAQGAAYSPGAIDMTRGSQYVIDHYGEVNDDISVYGAPTEGNLIGTFVITRDGYANFWSVNILEQLRRGAE